MLSFCQLSYDKHLSNSPFLAKICLFEKSVIVKEAFIVISHLNFVQTFHVFFPNSPFTPRFAILVKISNYQQAIFGHLIWIFGKPFITSCLMFAKIVIFVQIANSQHASFVISFNFCQTLWIAAKFTISVIIAICQGAPFCHLFCQLFKNVCQTFDNFLPNLLLFVISFEYLAKPLMNFWHTRHFC